MTFNKNMLTSNKQEWATPPWLYQYLNEQFNFTLDPCATPSNAKCFNYYTIEHDGLSQPWTGHTVFVNPPYIDTEEWALKALHESENGATVVMLAASRTDTKYFHEYYSRAREIWFLRPRIRFLDENGSLAGSPTFGNLIVVFKRDPWKTPPIIRFVDLRDVKKNYGG